MNPESLTVRNAILTVAMVAAAPVQVLMSIGWFDMQVSDQTFSVEDCYGQRRHSAVNFMDGLKLFYPKSSQVFLAVWVDCKYIINIHVPPPCTCTVCSCFSVHAGKNFSFEVMHEYIRI